MQLFKDSLNLFELHSPSSHHLLPGASPSSASSCASEMERWLEDIRMAIDLAEQGSGPLTDLLSPGLADNSKSTVPPGAFPEPDGYSSRLLIHVGRATVFN